MSWRDAPLYVEAFDLTRWVTERAGSWEHEPLARLATGSACELVSSVSLALTFPATRARHLEGADEGIVRLRTLLRIARAQGLLSGGALRFAAGRLEAIGRMVGGWRKRLDRSRQRTEGRRALRQDSGDGPPAARRA